jgi:hypothetical protein
MNTKKLTIGTILGFVGYFMGGFLLYNVVFKNLLESTNPGMSAVQAEPNIATLAIGNLVASFLLNHIFTKWASISTLLTGAIAGFTIGALLAFSYDCMLLGTTNLMTWPGVFVDTIVYGLISGLAGALIGWWYGYKK